jgi:hypothetical protein
MQNSGQNVFVNIKIDVLVEPRGSDTKLHKYLEIVKSQAQF